MSKGRLNNNADIRQQTIESPMFYLGTTLVSLELVDLRVKQAIDRTGLVELLGPARDDIHSIIQNIKKTQSLLKPIWQDGQSKRWEN